MAIKILSSENISGEVLIASGKYLSWGTAGSSSIEGSTVSNKLQFRTNSANAMIIDSSQNVGIGTVLPDTLLNVESASINTAILTLGCTKNDSSWTLGDVVGAVNFFSADESGPEALVRGSMALVAEATSGGDMGLSFSTYNNTERVRITATGRMGIGTTLPSNTLEVKGLFAAPLATGTAQNGIVRFSQTSGAGILDIGFGDTGNGFNWLQSRLSLIHI